MTSKADSVGLYVKQIGEKIINQILKSKTPGRNAKFNGISGGQKLIGNR